MERKSKTMKKCRSRKWLACLLAAAMAVTLFPAAAGAAEEAADTWDGTADISWYDADDPQLRYEITTAEQLAGLSQLVNGKNDFEGVTFLLASDIDLSGHTWVSIGTGNNASGYFAGVFDGGYHSVYNMTTGETHHGLFGIVSGGTVRNLGVENADITYADGDSSLRAGILMDWAHNADILNCFTTGSITTNSGGGKDIGGIAGQGMYGTTIIGCYSSAVITSKAYDSSEAIGGLVGSWETQGVQPIIADCYFDGEILFRGGPLDIDNPTANTGMTNSVGGILGMCFDNEPDLLIKNCMVATETVEAPSDYNMEMGNGGMWIAWYQMTGQPENCYWPLDDRGWPACIAFETYAYSGGTDGLYFEECGTPTTDFTDPAVLAGLQENAQPGVAWVMGFDHPTFAWDIENIPADYTAVDAALERIPEDLSPYTGETVQALEALTGQIDRSLSRAEQETVDTLAAAVNTAIDALAYKPADYTAVDAAIAAAEELNPDDYLNFSVVTAAVAAVNRDLNITGQAIVDGYAEMIETAVAALVYKPADYTTVDAAIAAAIALNPENYADFSAVTAAVGAVERDKNITEQDIVDGYAAAIQDALDALVYKPADYTAVDAAIAAAEALTPEDYVDFSAVTAAVQAVERDKNITEQVAVDGYAEAIQDVLDGLIRKGDLDKDGRVTIEDIMAVCRLLAQSSAGEAPAPESLAIGDMNGDGQLAIDDVMDMCKLLARNA